MATLTPVHRALHAMRQGSKRARGVEVTYVDLSTGASTKLTAVLARNFTELETENSVHRGEKLHDFLVDADDMSAEPERGDYILLDGRRYLVTHPAGEKVFAYHDTGRNSYRIHTIEVPYDTAPLPPPDGPDDEIAAYGHGETFYGNPGKTAYRPPPSP